MLSEVDVDVVAMSYENRMRGSTSASMKSEMIDPTSVIMIEITAKAKKTLESRKTIASNDNLPIPSILKATSIR
jgi:hypothetical protein